MSDNLHTALLVGLLLVSVAMYTVASVYAGRTLVQWWLPWAIAAAVALVSGLTLWRLWFAVSRSERFIWNYILHIVVATGLFSLLILGANSWLAPDVAPSTVQATILSKYREEHHHSRRVGRRYVANGTPYYDYHIRLQLPSGRCHSLSIPFSTYNTLRPGQSIPLSLRPGLLWPIVSLKK